MDCYKDCADFSSLKASLKGARPTVEKICRKTTTKHNEETEEYRLCAEMASSCKVADFPEFTPQPNLMETVLPFTKKLAIKCASQVTCTDFDPTCAYGKLVTGSSDGILSFYDFARLQPSSDDPASPAASRLIQVSSHSSSPISFIQYKKSGDIVLMGTKSSSPLLLDANSGKLRQECCKGDRYVMDQRQVKGHTGMVTCGMFTEQDGFITGGDDGTVRQWVVGRREQLKTAVLLDKRQTNGFYEKPTVGCLDHFEHQLVVGVDDGIVRLCDTRSYGCKSLLDTTDLTFISSVILDSNLIYCKSLQRITLFDQRNPKQFICQSATLTNCDKVGMVKVKDHLITTAINSKKESRLFVLSTDDLSLKSSIDYGDCTISSIDYSKSLNQVVVGGLNGLDVYFDDDSSQKGALLYKPFVKRRSKRDDMFIAPTAAQSVIHTPNALPLFALSAEESEVLADPLNLRRLRDRLDVKKSSRPDAPVRKEGHDGRLGSGPNASYMRQILDRKATQSGKRTYFDRDEDPREALLKYAEVAEREPVFISPAYQQTQPDPVLDYTQPSKETK